MRLGRTRLPIPGVDYERDWGSQLIRAIEQNFDSAFANIDNSAATTGYYGSFFDTTTQTAAAINTPYAMRLNTTAESNQIAVISDSRITFKNRGTYNIQFSAQLDQTSGSSHNIYIWLRKNGVDVPSSSSVVAIQGTSAELVAAWNFVVTVLGGDYVQIMWAVSNTNVQIVAAPANAFSPAIPSVIVTAVSV
jgi:outer membrane lipoprotein-sorting protein